MSKLDSSLGLPQNAAAVDISSTDATFSAPSVIYVGSPGDVIVSPVGGQAAVTFKNVPAGSYIQTLVTGVTKTGTTASSLVRLY